MHIVPRRSPARSGRHAARPAPPCAGRHRAIPATVAEHLPDPAVFERQCRNGAAGRVLCVHSVDNGQFRQAGWSELTTSDRSVCCCCGLERRILEVFAVSDSIIDVSHGFFDEYVKPIVAAGFPDEFAAMAFGVWGLGSEALKMDDEYSRDHHWGLRIDAIMPLELLQAALAGDPGSPGDQVAAFLSGTCARRAGGGRRRYHTGLAARTSFPYDRHRPSAADLRGMVGDPRGGYHPRDQRRGVARSIGTF